MKLLRVLIVGLICLVYVNPVAALPDAYTLPYINIDGNPHLVAEFQDFYQFKRRNKYYHGQPPETEYQSFVDSVREEWIEQILLDNYLRASNIEIPIDQQEIDTRAKKFEEQMVGVPSWKEVGPAYMPIYRKRLVRDLIYRSYKAQLFEETQVSETDVKVFYDKHPEKFTQPMRNNVSLILIGVAPSAGGVVWKEARTEMERIRFEIANGRDFAEMAEVYSTDPTADQGGDMGVVHKGSISSIAQTALNEIEPGDLTPVLTLLQGVALFKLNERFESEHHSFAEVKQRAAGLCLQNKQQQRWLGLMDDLRQKAKVDILIVE